MARRDYVDDPNAPAANSVVPSVVAVVRNDHGDLLMIHRADNGLWALPGRGHDIGESISNTVVREVREETGIDVEVTGLVGLYTNPNHVMAYDDGEVRQQFSICFTARPVGGALRTSGESREVAWVAPARLDALSIHPSMRLRIAHALADLPRPTSDDLADGERHGTEAIFGLTTRRGGRQPLRDDRKGGRAPVRLVQSRMTDQQGWRERAAR
jgi:ADP-ribose pyrophosphatase YjhB (NUDIX family)